MTGPVVPSGGYQPPAPPPVTVAKRIPEDLPYVVRPSPLKRLAQFLAWVLFVMVLLTWPLVLAVTRDGVLADLFTLLLCCAGVVVVVLAYETFARTVGGPVLALHPQGIWVRTRPSRGRAVFLPWAAVARVWPRRVLFEQVLYVRPHDWRGRLSAGYATSLTFADRPEHEVRAAIAHYAAGRVRPE